MFKLKSEGRVIFQLTGPTVIVSNGAGPFRMPPSFSVINVPIGRIIASNESDSHLFLADKPIVTKIVLQSSIYKYYGTFI